MKLFTQIRVLGIILLFLSIQPLNASDVAPIFLPGNPSCSDLGYDFGYRPLQWEAPPSGSYIFPDGLNTLDITSDGIYFDWTSTLNIDAVILKGGPNANVYIYDPEEYSDTGLHSPINPNNNQPFGCSHIELCYDYELDVEKTAETAFERAWGWAINNSADQTELTLSPGQQFLVNYTVTVDTAFLSENSWAVSGDINIDNNSPFDASIISIWDEISGDGYVAVDCGGISFPYTLSSYASLSCTYISPLPDATSRSNTVIVQTIGLVGGNQAVADIVFGDPTTEIDECADVSDSYIGFLGTVCADSAPAVFSYTRMIGPYSTCGSYSVDNTASIVGNDTNGSQEDSWTVTVNVPCLGCTLAQGYWKTHSEYGSAPYDDTWTSLSNRADTPFFETGQTYYEILQTPPQGGNAYIILAHQYIAAELNMLNGAYCPQDVIDAFKQAGALLDQYAADMQIPKGSPVRIAAVRLHGILDSYNNGYIGPGHCDE